MKNTKKTALLLSAVMLFTTVFCACGSSNSATGGASSTPSSEPSAEAVAQILVIGSDADFKSGSEEKTLVFDNLMDYAEGYKPGPRIITECIPNDDFTEFTLKIRDDVTFSDGTKLTADIVKFDIEYWPVYRSCGYIDYLDSVTVVDDTPLHVKMTGSYGSFQDELPKIWVTKADGVDDKGNFTSWIGTGPYILQDYQKDMGATLIRNETYWRKEKMPGITKVEVKVITDSNARILAIKSGDVDVLGLNEHYSVVDYANVAELQSNPNLKVEITDGYATTNTYGVNWKSGVCTDANVRKALSYGVDRETLCSKILFGVASAGDKLLCDYAAYSPKDSNYTYDPEKAKEYLKTAGYTDTDSDGYVDKNGEKLTIDLIIKEGQQNRNVAVYVQDNLKQIGVEMTLEVLDAATFKTRVTEGSYDLCASHPWYAPAPIYLVWRGDSEKYDDYGLGYGVSNRVHEITKEILKTGDDSERVALFDELWDIEDEFVAGIPLFVSPRVYVYKKNIEGLKFCPSLSEIDLSQVVIK